MYWTFFVDFCMNVCLECIGILEYLIRERHREIAFESASRSEEIDFSAFKHKVKRLHANLIKTTVTTCAQNMLSYQV